MHGGEIAPYRYISGLVDMVIAIFWVENVHFKLVQKEAGLYERHALHFSGRNMISPRRPNRTVERFLLRARVNISPTVARLKPKPPL